MNNKQRLDQLISSLRKKGLLGKALAAPDIPEIRQTHRDVDSALGQVDRFVEESKKCEILVTGSGYGSYSGANINHYPNFY
jgi:hypothetical protein